jgi:CheY-like chemotaxis protein
LHYKGKETAERRDHARVNKSETISELAMPDEGGYSLIAKVRAMKSASGKRIPAVALNAYVRVEDSARIVGRIQHVRAEACRADRVDYGYRQPCVTQSNNKSLRA